MNAAISMELRKLRTTRTVIGLLAAMLGIVVLASLLHCVGLSEHLIQSRDEQLRILLMAGEGMGVVFAALLGSASITGEYRHGTIRPTLLAIPQRSMVIAAKALVALLAGATFGAIATGIAAAVSITALASRVSIRLDGGDILTLVTGGALAGALWAALALGVGAIVRNQAAAAVGLLSWILIVEGLVADGVPRVARLLPGALAQSLAGQRTSAVVQTPGVAALLLTVFALAIVMLGMFVTARRDCP